MTTDDEGRAIPHDELSDSAFWAADLLEVFDYLVALIRDRRPQVIAIYDQNGNYDHPGHIQTHHVTIYTTVLAGVSSYRPDLGKPRRMSRVLWISPNSQTWSKATKKVHELGMPLSEGMDEEAMHRRLVIDPHRIAAVILCEGRADLCQAALKAHRSQVDPKNPLQGMFRFIRTVEGTGEAYRLAAGVPLLDDSPTDDLFAGFDV